MLFFPRREQNSSFWEVLLNPNKQNCQNTIKTIWSTSCPAFFFLWSKPPYFLNSDWGFRDHLLSSDLKCHFSSVAHFKSGQSLGPFYFSVPWVISLIEICRNNTCLSSYLPLDDDTLPVICNSKYWRLWKKLKSPESCSAKMQGWMCGFFNRFNHAYFVVTFCALSCFMFTQYTHCSKDFSKLYHFPCTFAEWLKKKKLLEGIYICSLRDILYIQHSTPDYFCLSVRFSGEL